MQHFGSGDYHNSGVDERPRVFALRLETKNTPDTVHRLRAALKVLLRRFQFRCVDLREEGER